MTKVACIGAGYFSRFHLDGWARLPGVEVVGICDRDLTRARATDLPAFDDFVVMLDTTGPDIVDIILPPDQQAAAIRTALASRPRAIICQKPFCASLDQARAVVAIAEDAGIPLIVHENFRFQPWYQTINNALQDGSIGDVLQATFRMRPGDGQGPRAYLDRQPYFQKMDRFLVHETGVHWVDVFRFLFGGPLAVYADLRQVNPAISGEDAGFIIFDHPGGVRALFDGNRLLDHAAENTRCTMGEALFEGTQGTITLQGDGSVHLRRFGDVETAVILAPDTSGQFGGDCAYYLQEHVLAALQGTGGFQNLAANYLEVMEIEAAIYRSAETGTKVDLPG